MHNKCVVEAVHVTPELQRRHGPLAFRIDAEPKVLTVIADNKEDYDQWIAELRRCIKSRTARMRRDEQLGRTRSKHHRSRTEGAIVWLQPSSVSLFSRPSSLSVSAPSGTTGGEYSSTTTTAKNLDVERTKERLNNLGWG